MKPPLLLLILLFVNQELTAQPITGKVNPPTKSTALTVTGNVAIIRGGRAIKTAAIDDDGAFSIEQIDDGVPSTYLIVSDSFGHLTFLDNAVNVSANKMELQFPSFKPVPLYSANARSNIFAVLIDRIEALRKVMETVRNVPALAKDLKKYVNECLLPPKCSILIPAYFYPGGESLGEWKRLLNFVKKCKVANIEVVVILNVNSGSGFKGTAIEPNADYQKLVTTLNQNRIKWVGYLAGNYGKPRGVSLTDDFDYWMKAYPNMSGVFIDELPSNKSTIKVFSDFCSHARKGFLDRKNLYPLMIGNAGVSTDGSFASDSLFDWLCVNENSAGKSGYIRPDWLHDSEATRAGSIVHGLKSGKQISDAIAQTLDGRGSFIYLTDQSQENNEVLWTRMPGDQVLNAMGTKLKFYNDRIESLRIK